MLKKTIFTLLLFLAPIAFFEQPKQDSSSLIIRNKNDMIERNNLQLINNLFEANEKNSIEIKNCWEKGDLLSQKRYCSSNVKYSHTYSDGY